MLWACALISSGDMRKQTAISAAPPTASSLTELTFRDPGRARPASAPADAIQSLFSTASSAVSNFGSHQSRYPAMVG